MNFIKSIFYKNKILRNWNTTEEECLKQRILAVDIDKNLNKHNDLLERAKAAVTDLGNGNKAKESDMKAYLFIRSKYPSIFKENSSQMENPSATDVVQMDSMSIDEVNEIIYDKRKILFRRFHQAISEIQASSEAGGITRPT